MHLAVGQGDLLTSPLQMAVAYSTLANAYLNGGNGTVVTPHLAARSTKPGRLVQSAELPPTRHVHLNDADLNVMTEGSTTRRAEPGGTSADVWSGWGPRAAPVFGETAPPNRSANKEQSWYMCLVGDPKRPIVIAVTVEQGGFGAETPRRSPA